VRFVTNELPGNKRYALLYQVDELIDGNAALIKHLAHLPDVKTVDNPNGMRLALPAHEAWLDVDVKTIKTHHANLSARITEVEDEATRLSARLNNDNYLAKAPAKLVEETKLQLAETEKLLKRLKGELEITESIA